MWVQPTIGKSGWNLARAQTAHLGRERRTDSVTAPALARDAVVSTVPHQGISMLMPINRQSVPSKM